MVTVDGRTAYERYLLISPATTTDVDAIGKTILATLIGIAVDEGALAGPDETLAEMLPDYRKDMSTRVAGITLEQLLTMTAGLSPDESLYPERAARQGDWVQYILRHELDATPGSRFIYSSAGSHLLSAALGEATGRNVLDYAREKLFDPLGIDTTPDVGLRVGKDDLDAYAQAEFTWPSDPQGRQFGGGGMKLRGPDLVKLGQLWLDRGTWNGRRVVSAGWSDRMRERHVGTGPHDVGSGYGYQQWITEADGHAAFAATGFGGQLVEVVPDLGLVVVFLSSVTLTTTPADLVGVADPGTYRSLVDTLIAPRVG